MYNTSFSRCSRPEPPTIFMWRSRASMGDRSNPQITSWWLGSSHFTRLLLTPLKSTGRNHSHLGRSPAVAGLFGPLQFELEEIQPRPHGAAPADQGGTWRCFGLPTVPGKSLKNGVKTQSLGILLIFKASNLGFYVRDGRNCPQELGFNPSWPGKNITLWWSDSGYPLVN